MPVVTRYWKILTGAALAAAGGAAIVIAWFRVRDLLEIADQVPILVSGGLGGLTLVITGIWLLRSHEHELLLAHLQATTEQLDRLQDDVALLRCPAGPAAEAPGS